MIGNIEFQELQLVAQICLNMLIHSRKGWLSQMSLSTFGENSISSLQLGTPRFIDRYLPNTIKLSLLEDLVSKHTKGITTRFLTWFPSKPIKVVPPSAKKQLTLVRACTMQCWEMSRQFDDLHSLSLSSLRCVQVLLWYLLYRSFRTVGFATEIR